LQSLAGLTPLLTWRSRLPGAIGSWFARDLVRKGLALVDAGRVVLRTVEDQRIEAIVRDGAQTAHTVTVEWGGGTGPLALRTACSDGSSGICAHIVATLEAVRSQMEPTTESAHDAELAWLPTPEIGSRQQRARCIWIVF
jgi:uncharacterized Zn finger protein